MSPEEARAAQIEADLKAADKARADAEETEANQNSVTLASIAASLATICGRMDALEAKSAADDAEEEATMAADAKAAADAAAIRALDPDGSKQRNMEARSRVINTAADSFDEALTEGLAGLTGTARERHLSAAMAEAQARADAVYGGFGVRAPPPVYGERISAYRTRLIRGIRHHSAEYARVDPGAIADAELFKAVEGKIYVDSAIRAKSPLCGPGELEMRIKRDAAGREIREFFGDPNAWMKQFQQPEMFVTGFNLKPNG